MDAFTDKPYNNGNGAFAPILPAFITDVKWYESFIVVRNFLTTPDYTCLEIFKDALKPATVNAYGLNKGPLITTLSETRVAMTTETDRLYRRIRDKLVYLNAANFGFSLIGIIEYFNLLKYENGSYSNWHADYTNIDRSKITFTCPLNDNYEGGIFELLNIETPKLLKGDLMVFPSFIAHRVTPVTNGTRFTLTGWIAGERLV